MPRHYCRGPIPVRLAFHTNFDGPVPEHCPELGSCHIWTATRTTRGYAKFQYEPQRPIEAHKVVWELEHGPVPKGYQIHHLCENKLCVRLSHMTLMTLKAHRAIQRDRPVRS